MNPYNRPLEYCGMKIITDPNMVEQFRFPRSKGKRIKKKWHKNPDNFRPATHFIVNLFKGVAYCHPVVAEDLWRNLTGPLPMNQEERYE